MDAIRGTDGLSVRDKLARLALIHPERGVLGSVVEMFPVGTIWYSLHSSQSRCAGLSDSNVNRYVIFTLDLEAAIWLVSSKLIRGVSLSHLAPDIPLEVSITTSPARPLCYIEKSGTLSEILEYKRFILSSIPRDNMAHLKEILDKLDATDREAIESRLTLIQGKLEDAQKTLTEKEEATCAAEAKAADAESKLETAEKTMQSFQLTAASDAARLRQEVGACDVYVELLGLTVVFQVSTLKAHIDPEILENCSLSEKTLESLYNDNPHEVSFVSLCICVHAILIWFVSGEEMP